MKINIRFAFAFLLMLMFSTATFAQVGRIEQTSIDHDKSRVDALTVTMKPERKDIQKAFDDWIDDRYDINMKGGGLFSDKNMRQAEAVNIPAISTDNITLYTMTEEKNGESRMTIFASRGLGNYFKSSDYPAFTGLEAIMDNFLSSYLPEYYEERVAEATEELEDFRKDQKKAREDITDNEKKIKKLQEENEKLREQVSDLDIKIMDAEKMLTKRKEIKREVKRQVTGRNRR